MKEEHEALAKQFCPTLRFEKGALYTPTNFIELCKRRNGEIEFKCSKPKKKWKKAGFDKNTGLFWFAPAIYVHFLEDVEILIRGNNIKVPIIIQYYFYYAFNDYLWGIIQVPFLKHPHDWEWIQVALDEKNQIISYSVSAHGTNLGISKKKQIEFFMKDGFHLSHGSHNFGTIFHTLNHPQKSDIKIEPETLIPSLGDKKIPFKDSIILLDHQYNINFLKKFSFYPVLAPWEYMLYHLSTWKPEFWTWSTFQRFVELSKEIRL